MDFVGYSSLSRQNFRLAKADYLEEALPYTCFLSHNLTKKNCVYVQKDFDVNQAYCTHSVLLFSSPGLKGQVSFSHHLASGVVNFYKNLLL